MNEIVLQAEKRTLGTKGEVAEMRRNGRIPAVAYGDEGGPVVLSLDEKSLQTAMHSERGRNALLTLQVDGSSHAVLLKEIQRHPISRAILHVDLHRVSLKKKIEAQVPVHTKGEAPGVKIGGGILEHVLREIRVRCLPTDIPAEIIADVSALQVGQSIKVRELPIPANVEIVGDEEGIIVNIVVPTVLEEPAAADATTGTAATAEPEVIKKGKTDEEAAAAGAKPAAAGDKKAAPAAAKPDAKK